jgi:hypothetical protein
LRWLKVVFEADINNELMLTTVKNIKYLFFIDNCFVKAYF